MFNWMFNWWNRGGEQNNAVAADFDEQPYKRYTVDRYMHSDVVRRAQFKCHPFAFEFRYVLNNNDDDDEYAGRCCNVMDFCKGLKINHNLLIRCNFDSKHVRHLNEWTFGPTSPAEMDSQSLSMGSLFATKHGLLHLLQQLPFARKDKVLAAIEKMDNTHDNVCDRIETVLKHVKTLNTNSDKFISAHESFKQEIGARFEQFEQRLQTLDTKFNALQCTTLRASSSSSAAPGVVFPRDTSKHQHLAVFMGRAADERDSTQIAFVRGQEGHFRKRKLEFEDDMDIMFEGVHPNPLLAVHCIREELASSGYKMRRLSKKAIEVKCTVNVAKDIVRKAIMNKN
ncbi:38.7KDA [Dione juno nucleopolyhedrovirus]|uniref:38.7KDA n=1 Tax=Dione juno nucleopolyhedrovirus TaxID=2594175 RepID=A0AAE6H378_9ABAC|nr:38.7KDA [Dione juno nucleopolyhedrovirus]QDL57000.1 38.7KDA [Dione juno nucleopolyhedrovirus]